MIAAPHGKRLYWLAVLCGLLPCVYVLLRNSMNYDIAWLVVAAERMMAGGASMAKDAYDPNPPLSFIFMMPPVLLAKLLPIPVYTLTTLYFFGFVAYSIWALQKILSHFKALNENDSRVFLTAYAAAFLILPTMDFGERDHILLAGLLPFILLQLLLTDNVVVPRKFQGLVFIAGAVLILLKPHFGILPALLLLHRAIKRRNPFPVLSDLDVITLAAATLGYIALIWFAFHDYATVIFPDALALYAPLRNLDLMGKAGFYLGMIAVFPALYMFLPVAPEKRRFVLFLFFASAACLIPYTVQARDYWYHLLPSLTLYVVALAMTVQTLCDHKWTGKPHWVATGLGAIIAAYILIPLNTIFPSHAQFKNLEITKLVSDCPQPCSYFMFNDNIGIIHPTDLYTNRIHASRFSALWFLPPLYAGLNDDPSDDIVDLPREKLLALRDKYAAMVGEDFNRYQPKIVFLGRFQLNDASPDIFDFPAFFSSDPTFAAEWKNYHFERQITINARDYYRGTALDKDTPVTFDLYRRN